MARPLTPPPLSGRATKKNSFISASLTYVRVGATQGYLHILFADRINSFICLKYCYQNLFVKK